MTADGPLGPAGDAKQAPVEWARATGRPVYMFAWSARRSVRLRTWDRLVLPVPFTRGSYGYRRWDTDVPHKLTADDYVWLRKDLSANLNLITREMDDLAGVTTKN